jgi:hypothetical protein
MASEFDRLAGTASGRIQPQGVTPADGDWVFVLGADGATEPVVLAEGDGVSVQQVVDLTAVDLVGVSCETIGVAMNAIITSPLLPLGAGTVLAAWYLTQAWLHASCELQPKPDLRAAGDLALAVEDYSASEFFCREIPVGSTTALLSGTNDPPAWTAPQTQYSLDAWLDFDADAIVDSDGVSPTIFSADDGTNELTVFLSGEGGIGAQHRWWVAVRHCDGGAPVTVVFTGYPITASTGWHMLTVTYHQADPPAERCKLFVDGVFACYGDIPMTSAVGAVTSTGTIQLASPQLTGRISQVRLKGTEATPTTIDEDYQRCVSPADVTALAWHMQVLIDGTVYCDRIIAEGEQRTWRDFYAPVRHLSGDHAVEFTLKILEVP